MMVGSHAVAVAVRQPDGRITTAVEPFSMPGRWAKDIPFLRGLVAIGGMLKLAGGTTKLENRMSTGSKVKNFLPQLAPGVGAALAERLTREMAKKADDRMVVPIETVAGVALPFLAFGVGGKLPGVRDLWRYHGAEHKAVNAAEAGLDLTPANAGTMSRVHPRCGTVMAFWGLLGGALARSLIARMRDNRGKTIAGAVAGPLILSTAYEAVRLGYAVRDNPVGKAVFTPVWNTQRMTTLEPGEEELEVAVAALQAVIDYDRAHAA